MAEICCRVWGTPANFNGFCISAALLHGTLVVGVSQTLRRWTEGATYIRQGGHHVGHWPTFLVDLVFSSYSRLYCRAKYQSTEGVIAVFTVVLLGVCCRSFSQEEQRWTRGWTGRHTSRKRRKWWSRRRRGMSYIRPVTDERSILKSIWMKR